MALSGTGPIPLWRLARALGLAKNLFPIAPGGVRRICRLAQFPAPPPGRLVRVAPLHRYCVTKFSGQRSDTCEGHRRFSPCHTRRHCRDNAKTNAAAVRAPRLHPWGKSSGGENDQ